MVREFTLLLQAAAEKAAYWPQIGFSGAYELNAKNFIGAEGTNWTLMVALQFSIFDNSRYARVRQNRARQLQAERGRELLTQAVALEVKRAFHEHEAATQRLEQARKAMSPAEESLRMIQNRYREGLTTLVVLQDAETALTGARTRAISAGRDAYEAGLMEVRDMAAPSTPVAGTPFFDLDRSE